MCINTCIGKVSIWYMYTDWYSVHECRISINQSVKMYIAPLQDTYSEVLLTQAMQVEKNSLEKVVELRTTAGTVWEVP